MLKAIKTSKAFTPAKSKKNVAEPVGDASAPPAVDSPPVSPSKAENNEKWLAAGLAGTSRPAAGDAAAAATHGMSLSATTPTLNLSADNLQTPPPPVFVDDDAPIEHLVEIVTDRSFFENDEAEGALARIREAASNASLMSYAAAVDPLENNAKLIGSAMKKAHTRRNLHKQEFEAWAAASPINGMLAKALEMWQLAVARCLQTLQAATMAGSSSGDASSSGGSGEGANAASGSPSFVKPAASSFMKPAAASPQPLLGVVSQPLPEAAAPGSAGPAEAAAAGVAADDGAVGDVPAAPGASSVEGGAAAATRVEV